MRGLSALLGMVLLSMCSCTDDDLLQAEIQKTVEISFEVNANRLSLTSGRLEFSESSDIFNEEFGEYQDQVRDFNVDQLRFQISGFQPVPGVDSPIFTNLDFDLRSLENGSLPIDMIELNDLRVTDLGSPLVLYRSDSTSAQVLFNAIQFIRLSLLREEAFVWEGAGNLSGLPGGESLEIKFLLDLTAEVLLD